MTEKHGQDKFLVEQKRQEIEENYLVRNAAAKTAILLSAALPILSSYLAVTSMPEQLLSTKSAVDCVMHCNMRYLITGLEFELVSFGYMIFNKRDRKRAINKLEQTLGKQVGSQK